MPPPEAKVPKTFQMEFLNELPGGPVKQCPASNLKKNERAQLHARTGMRLFIENEAQEAQDLTLPTG